jgi:hypothetical protein
MEAPGLTAALVAAAVRVVVSFREVLATLLQ